MCASRTSAPRGVSTLCRLWVAFSAMHSARRSGKRKFISAGASVPGVSWKTISIPSTVSSLAGLGDLEGGGDQADGAERGGLPEAGADLAGRPLRQQAPYM